MIINKLIVFALVAATSGCSISSSKSLPPVSQPISQPKYEAWNQTNWLMSEKEVINTFPGKVVTMEQAKTWSDYAYQGTNDEIDMSCLSMRSAQPEDKCNALAMKGFEIGNKNYNVFFYFTNDQLSRVKLVCDGPQDIDFWKASGCFGDINQLLTQKYGEPIENEEKKTPIGYSSYNYDMNKWKTDHTNIVTQYSSCVGCENNKGAVMELSYWPDPQKVPIKSNLYEKDKDNI